MMRKNMNTLILHDPNPTSLLTIARTQPDIVGGREADLETAMRA
jgi:hypothetical protein